MSVNLLKVCILLKGLLAVDTQSPTLCDIQCPRDGSQCIDGNFPNPVDCGSFCSCTNCLPILQYCPPGLHYYPPEDRCIREEDSTCQVSTPAPTVSTTPEPKSPVALFAARSSYLNEEQSAVDFNYVPVNLGGYYDSITHNVTVPKEGFYFSSLSAGADTRMWVEYELRTDGDKEATLYRDDESHLGPDTLSRDVLRFYFGGENASIASHSPRLASSADGLQTSWSLFSITDAMIFDVLFSVGRDTPFSESNPLEFNDIFGDIGGGWNGSNHVFVAPLSGLYFFSLSAGTEEEDFLHLLVRHNGAAVAGIERNFLTFFTDTIGRSFMLHMETGDTVWVEAGSPGYSSSGYQTSFSGFLYNPPTTSVAWSLAIYREMEFPTRIDPLQWDFVQVDEGGAVDGPAHQVRCPQSGYYYVHLSAGARPVTNVGLDIIYNGNVVGQLTRQSIHHSQHDTMSRSLIVRCAFGGRLWVAAQAGTALWGDFEILPTSFCGFLIYSDSTKSHL